MTEVRECEGVGVNGALSLGGSAGPRFQNTTLKLVKFEEKDSLFGFKLATSSEELSLGRFEISQ